MTGDRYLSYGTSTLVARLKNIKYFRIGSLGVNVRNVQIVISVIFLQLAEGSQ